ncbi:MAG TPA: 2-phospho-L-lactate transferase [Bradyrhizobium sp.]|nr:2-phospho-L-lactate transferase [Bradyrhizobium sp.]
MSSAERKIVALAGGVGGAKLADGLARILRDRLVVIVNTGDDFEHLGLHISPDLDTVMYTLADLADRERGWGLSGETWTFMEQVARLGGPDWFRLGDRDIATHAIRTSRLRAGDRLTAVTADLCRALGIASELLPMSDDPVRTTIHSGGRTLPFQDYFVRLHCEVPVERLSFEGAAAAHLNPLVAAMSGAQAPEAIIICPSNPYLSIDPILSVPAMRDWIDDTGAPVIAVSPIVGGAAIKGPAAKIMRELNVQPSATSVAAHYCGLVDGFVIDAVDNAHAADIEAMGIATKVTETVMRSIDDRKTLAESCLAFLEVIRNKAR